MDAHITALLACPRCRGDLVIDETECSCVACGRTYPVKDGIPRLADDAVERDPHIAAEWTAQLHAHALYSDERSVLNHWEHGPLRRMLDWLGALDGPVLDVGCGIGVLGRINAERGAAGFELLGIDLQADLLLDAGAGYAGVLEADVHRLPLQDDAFAGVVVSNALHHVADPRQAMEESVRVLAPGGVLVAYDPRRLAPIERAKKILRRNDAAFTEVHRAFRPEEYRSLLEGAGLVVEEVTAVDAVGPLVATGLDYLKAGRLGARRIARGLAAVDRAVARRDRRGRAGLCLAARTRKP